MGECWGHRFFLEISLGKSESKEFSKSQFILDKLNIFALSLFWCEYNRRKGEKPTKDGAVLVLFIR